MNTVFLYESELNEVVAQIPFGLSSINFSGGRGTGKTSFLRMLHERLGGKSFLCETRDPLQVNAILDDEHHQILLIDNFDELLAPSDPSSETISRLATLVGKLKGVTSDHSKSKKTIIVTTTGPFDVLSPRAALARAFAMLPRQLLTDYSHLPAQFEKRFLDPWLGGRGHWQNVFQRTFQRLIDSEPLRLAWAESVYSVTGGLPLLFGPVTDKLKLMLGQPLSENDRLRPLLVSGVSKKELPLGQRDENLERKRRLIRLHIELWLESDGMRKVKKAIRQLRDSESVNERQAFDYLLRCSMVGNCDVPDDMEVRSILLTEYALCHEDMESFRFIVPGEMLRALVRRAGAGRQIVTVEPDPDSTRRGELKIQNANGIERVRLGSSPWRILQFLFDRQDRLVTNEEIQSATTMDNRAVQQAVTRLRAKVGEHGIEVINEREKGYRLIIRSS